MKLWVVIPVGAGEHPPVAVTRTISQAEEAAQKWWESSDGYHDLEIRPYETGVLYETASRGIFRHWSSRTPTTRPVEKTLRAEYPRFKG